MRMVGGRRAAASVHNLMAEIDKFGHEVRSHMSTPSNDDDTCHIESFFLPTVLLVGHVVHPVNDFAVFLLLNGDVRHGCRRSGAVPMLLIRRKPDDIARMDLLDRTTIALRPPSAGCNDECLAEWMCMPGGSSTGFEGDTCTGDERGVRGREQRVNTNGASEPLRRTFSRRLRSSSLDFQLFTPISFSILVS